ncbi:MAG: acyl carrier protein [Proteobacteria bacterium]|nr:acyl carrier protein [Pseudomonadota bacterium]
MSNAAVLTALRTRIREFVTKNFYMADPEAFSDQTSFLDQGIIDSTGVLELVSFVESEWSLTVVDDEMVPQNFDSVDALVTFVDKKTS